MSIKNVILLIITGITILLAIITIGSTNVSANELTNLEKNLDTKNNKLNSINSEIKSIQCLIKKDKKIIKNTENDIEFFDKIKNDIETGYTLDITYTSILESYKSYLIKHKKETLKEIQGYKNKLKKMYKKRKKLRKTIKALKKKINNLKKKSFNGVLLSYDEVYNVSSNKLTKSKGVVRYNKHRETYYSQRVLPGCGLKIPGRHVADDGTIRDKDGYICVAAHPSFYPRGSKLMITLGPAKVYDCGCAYGTIDVYCNW